MVDQAERVEAGEVAAKTINNTLGTLVVCLNAAVKDRPGASAGSPGPTRAVFPPPPSTCDPTPTCSRSGLVTQAQYMMRCSC
jgi:hypothetical protein